MDKPLTFFLYHALFWMYYVMDNVIYPFFIHFTTRLPFYKFYEEMMTVELFQYDQVVIFKNIGILI